MPDRHPVATWPGVVAVHDFSYTISHGISPGTAVLRCLPQSGSPARVGALVVTDGVGKVTLPDCKLDNLRVDGGDGFIWSLEILDRRWKWRDLGVINGCYNQLDPHGKLIPWTIRSPQELVILCLQAMGETRYQIDMPPGLTSAQGLQFEASNPPWIGVTPTTGTNPPVNWLNETPAQALQNLCEQFGRHVIYRWSDDSVLIARPGVGATLPDGGSIAKRTPSLNDPETPTGVMVIGSPTRFQGRFYLEPVGLEWNDVYVPIDQLSYRPDETGSVQISTVAVTNPHDGDLFELALNATNEQEPQDGVLFTWTGGVGETAANVATQFANQINASQNDRIKGVMTALASGGVVTITGVAQGVAWTVYARLSYGATPGATFIDETTQAATSPGGGWEYSVPPLFANVKATDRLTYIEAQQRAQQSVFRCYRIVNYLSDGSPLTVPGFPLPILRRQQIILQDTQVEQVTPELSVANNLNQQQSLNFYNGYSRDKPAAVYGSIAQTIQQSFWHAFGPPNTPFEDQITVPFHVDPVEQMVVFSTPVYRADGPMYKGALLHLQTGCNIRRADTNEISCFTLSRVLPNMAGVTNFAVRHYPDVQLNVIGQYSLNSLPLGATLLEADALMRAKYYLDGMSVQYLLEGAETREYNGIEALDLDGAIAQITWQFGEGGGSTTVSRNSEHSIWIPPYPARRRAEFLRPAEQARILEATNPARIGSAVMDGGNQNSQQRQPGNDALNLMQYGGIIRVGQ